MGPLDQARRLVPIVAAGLIALSCGGGGNESAGGQAPSVPSAVTPAPPAPHESPSPPVAAPAGQPVWVPPGTFACALGPGTKDAGCDAAPPAFADAVNAAVDRVIAEQRDLFPGGDLTARVRDEEAIHVAVARILQAQGYCAGWDLVNLQVRNSNAFSEHYDLFDARGFLYLDPARRVRATCRPADFPLTAAERIHSLRVGFYGIQCPAGVAKPPNSSGRLPVGCLGHVTATAKDKFFGDVDARIHGPYINWELTQRRPFVDVRDDTNTEFNKALRAQRPGPFELCATVQGHRGCLTGEVIETDGATSSHRSSRAGECPEVSDRRWTSSRTSEAPWPASLRHVRGVTGSSFPFDDTRVRVTVRYSNVGEAVGVPSQVLPRSLPLSGKPAVL